MTSITGSLSAISRSSPADRMQTMLQQAVSTGTVNPADQGALSSALSDISKAMKSSGPPGQGATPASMKSKVDGLVDQEVSDGKLTSDQAAELKKVFASAAHSMHGGHGHGHAHAAASSDTTTTSDLDSVLDISTAQTSTTSGSSALTAFLKQLAQATSATNNYNGSGSTASNSLSSVLIDASA